MQQTDTHYITDNYNGLVIERSKTHSASDIPLMHTHNEHELYFLLSGSRRYLIGHAVHQVYEGDLVIIPKGAIHGTARHQSGGYDRYVVYFPDSYAEVLCKETGTESWEAFLNSGCIRFAPAYSDKLRQLFLDMEEEVSRPDNRSNLLCAGKLYEILLTAMRYGSPRPREPEKTSMRLEKVAAYITEHFKEPITLHEAAQMAYLEDSYFSRLFKKYTGFGFAEYLTQLRIGKATELLLSTELSVSEIAEACGFSGGNYFGDVFRRFCGCSPLEYRKRYRKDAELRRNIL